MIDLSLTDDQELLRATCSEFFAERSSPEVVRAAEPAGHDPVLWKAAAELGLATAAVPTEQGGGGGGVLDLAIVAVEVGRRVAPIPFVDAASARNLMASVGLADGVDPVLVPSFTTEPLAGDTIEFLPSGAVADVAFVLRDDELLAVDVVAADAHRPLPNFADFPLGDIDVRGLPVRVVAKGSTAGALIDRADLERRVLMAAALSGLAAEALTMTVDYVRERCVYGRPVAEFQAVQHRLADVTVGVDGARLLAFEAAWALDVRSARAEELALMALAFASEAAFRATKEGLQFHGGYGYTNEFDIQLYFRRAKGWPLIVGQSATAWQRIAALAYPGLGDHEGHKR